MGSMMRDSTSNASPRPHCCSVTGSVSNASVAFQFQNQSHMRLQLTQFNDASFGNTNIGNINNISNINNMNRNGVLTTEPVIASNCSHCSHRSGTSTRSASPPTSLSSIAQLAYTNLSEMNSYHAYLTGSFNHVNSLGGSNINRNNTLNRMSGLNSNGIYRVLVTNDKLRSHGKSKASRLNFRFGSLNNGDNENGNIHGKSGVEWIEKQLIPIQQRNTVMSQEYNGEYEYRNNVVVILFKLKQAFGRYDKPESCTLDDVVFDNNGNLLDRSKSLNKFEYLHYLSKYLRMSREDLLCKSIVDAFKFVKRFPNTALTKTYIGETNGQMTFELIILTQLQHTGHSSF